MYSITSRFGTRHEDVRGDPQHHRPELPPAREIRQRLAARAACEPVAHTHQVVARNPAFGMREQRGPAELQRGRDEHLGFAQRVGGPDRIVGRECAAGVRQQVRNRRRLVC